MKFLYDSFSAYSLKPFMIRPERSAVAIVSPRASTAPQRQGDTSKITTRGACPRMGTRSSDLPVKGQSDWQGKANMALRGLVEGECGAANPLVQWTSHFSQEKSMLRVRHSGAFHCQIVDIVPGQIFFLDIFFLYRMAWSMIDLLT